MIQNKVNHNINYLIFMYKLYTDREIHENYTPRKLSTIRYFDTVSFLTSLGTWLCLNQWCMMQTFGVTIKNSELKWVPTKQTKTMSNIIYIP